MSSIVRLMFDRIRNTTSQSASLPESDAWLERAIIAWETASKMEKVEHKRKAQQTASAPSPPDEKHKSPQRLSL